MDFLRKVKKKLVNLKEKISGRALGLGSWIRGLGKKNKIILGGSSGAALLSLMVVVVILATPKAYAVEVDGDMIGYVPKEGDLTTLIEEVRTSISDQAESADVVISEKEIVAEKAKDIKAKDIESITKEELEAAVIDKKICKVDAYAVSVDGKYVTSTVSKECGEKVLEKMKKKYKKKAESEDVDVEIVQKVEFTKAYADVEEVLCEKEMYALLTNEDEPVVDVQTTEILESEKSIEPKIEYKETSSLAKGEEEVESEGKEGLKKVSEEVVKVNGKEVESTEVHSEVLEESEAKVILVGTAEVGSTASGSSGSLSDSGSGSLGKPMSVLEISSAYGNRSGGFHRGTDFRNPQGTPIYAAESGTVTFASYSGTYGNVVKISHGNGLMTLYAHCDSMLVSSGQTVSKGQQIGTVGMTGRATGYHLHFEVQVNGNCTNPMNYL